MSPARESDDQSHSLLDAGGAARPSREELVGQIRFALSELASDNGQHRFEDLCRHFARERLVPNILPATGPVGVGGDQGRDFETFRSYLRDELGPHGAFAGRLQQGHVAFACTLQQEGLPSKIRQDIKKITASGSQVVAIYVFLVAPLPVATRHKLQEEVRSEHRLDLEIFDGPGLAEQLAERNLFWIAEQFLSLPAALRPEPPSEDDELPDWYGESRDRWRREKGIHPSRGELSSVIDGLRHAMDTPALRSDLPFWIDLIRPVALASDVAPDVRRRAQYEIAVAHVRGLGTMIPADSFTQSFLGDAVHQDDPGVFEDAAVLLSYSGTAAFLGQSNLDPDDLFAINKQLRERISLLLDAEPPRTRRARLLAVLGHLGLIPDPRAYGERTKTDPPTVNTAEMLDQARAEGVRDDVIAEMPVQDLSGAMEAWRTLASLLEDTPLFPLEAWTAQIEFLSPLLIDQPGWPEIEAAIDAATERLHGGDAAAARARDRAVRLQDAGRLRDALSEFHKAKIRWWNGDSLRGALLCMLGIAELYKSLHLPSAGKQYALAVAGIAEASADEEVIDLVPVSIMKASEMDYAAGAWLSALELADLGLIGHAVLLDSESDPWITHDFKNGLMTVGMALRAARAFCPEMVPIVEQVAARHDMLDELNKIEESVGQWDRERWMSLSDEQLLGRPFSDLGDERRIRFSALGTAWTVRAPNTHADSRAAERLAAAAQLLLVELAEDDVALLRSEIDVAVRVNKGGSLDDPSLSVKENGARAWRVDVSPANPNASPEEVEGLLAETTSVLSQILLDVSLLPPDQYFAATRRAFERGFWHKLGIGRPYDELAEVVPSTHFNHEARLTDPPFQENLPDPKEHAELEWQAGPGPTYEPDQAQEMLENRYRRLPEEISCTIATLRESSEFASLVAELRERGWLDWHLLTALLNLSINARLAAAGLNTREAIERPGGKEQVDAVVRKTETPDDVVLKASDLDIDTMEEGRRMGIPPLLRHWGLSQNGPFMPDIWDDFLAERYGYWMDDIPHPDPFAQ